jgi:hypothetical protein
MSAVAMISATDGWASNAGEYNHGYILRWDGSDWLTASGEVAFQESIAVVPGSNGDDVWTVGWWGTILHWDGSDWSTVDTCAGYLSNPPSFIDDEAALLELETLSATNLLDKDPTQGVRCSPQMTLFGHQTT